MTEISRPWDGIVTGDAGPYSDTQWQDVWGSFNGRQYDVADVNHLLFQPGVYKDQLNDLAINAIIANQVTMDTGRAVVNGTWYENDATVALAIADAVANPRVDRIVLRKDFVLQTVRLDVIQGAEAAAPVAPVLVQNVGVTWDLPLWQVYQAVGVGGVPVIWRDERDFIGQYEPIGLTDILVYVFEEFYTRSTLINTYPVGNFFAQLTGTCTVTQIIEAGFGAGGLNFAHGGGTGDECGVVSTYYRPDIINARMRMLIKNPATHANLDRTIGFVSALGTLTPADGVFFRADGVGNWYAVTRVGGVETATDTLQALDNVWRLFEIRQTGTDVVVFLINGVVVATHTTNIPIDVALSLVAYIFDNGVAPAISGYMHIDYAKVEGDR